MQPWLISWIVFCSVGLVLPAFLLIYAWRRNRPVISPLIIPVVSVFILALAMTPAIRLTVLGAEYGRRLYVTTDVFAALTLVNAIYAAIRKAWAAAIASVIISLAWFFLAVVNSVV